MAGPNLDNYVDVAARVREFREKFPEGSLQQVDLQFVEIAGKSWVVYTAAAYRDRDDPHPGHGTAWEPIPGPTAFTKDSEVQNAETSAWGRAIIAAGAGEAQRIASREEVRNRTGGPEEGPAQTLLRVLSDSGFEPAKAREIIGAALGKLITKLSDIDKDEFDAAIASIESAVADRLQLEEEPF